MEFWKFQIFNDPCPRGQFFKKNQKSILRPFQSFLTVFDHFRVFQTPKTGQIDDISKGKWSKLSFENFRFFMTYVREVNFSKKSKVDFEAFPVIFGRFWPFLGSFRPKNRSNRWYFKGKVVKIEFWKFQIFHDLCPRGQFFKKIKSRFWDFSSHFWPFLTIYRVF